MIELIRIYILTNFFMGDSNSEVLGNNKIENNYWYKKLSIEEKKKFDNLVKQRSALETRLHNLDDTKTALEKLKADYLEENLTFTDRLSLLNSDIDLLSRQIYKINLEKNKKVLKTKFDESNKKFEKSLSGLDPKNKELVLSIKDKDLSKIKAGEIYGLKQNGYDLSTLFLNSDKKEVDKNTMEVGDIFKVNFGGNNSLNRNIGAGDLIDISKIDKVKINGIIGERRLKPRPGYYSKDGRYLAIFDNYDIEIVSKKEYTKEEQEKSLLAFESRYKEIRQTEILSDFRDKLGKSGDNKELVLTGFSRKDLELLAGYLNTNLPKEISSDIKLDFKNSKIITQNNKSIKETINEFVPLSNLGTGYEKYKDIVLDVSSRYNIRPEKLINLINHENSSWDPLAGAPGSSAYGLGQMTDGTWSTYGKGLDRNNPRDQLDATCRYLEAITKRKGCSIEDAMAYYNTGEGIKSLSNSKIQEYTRLNPAIAKYIVGPVTADSYFKAAVKFYNS